MPLCKVAKWSFMTLDTLTIGADKEFPNKPNPLQKFQSSTLLKASLSPLKHMIKLLFWEKVNGTMSLNRSDKNQSDIFLTWRKRPDNAVSAFAEVIKKGDVVVWPRDLPDDGDEYVIGLKRTTSTNLSEVWWNQSP